jgi:hypothetical protein
MALSKDEMVSKLARPAQSVAVEELGGSVVLRCPTFTEWHELVRRHREIGEGQAPPADLMAATVAVVLANLDGSRMFTGAEVESLPPEFVMKIYQAAWSTVLRGPDAESEEKKG